MIRAITSVRGSIRMLPLVTATHVAFCLLKVVEAKKCHSDLNPASYKCSFMLSRDRFMYEDLGVLCILRSHLKGSTIS